MAPNTPSLLIDFFKENGRLVHYKKGEVVGDGSNPTAVYMINKGRVKVYSISDDGDQFIHIMFGPGEFFPLVWAVNDIQRDVYYETMMESRIWRVSKEAFKEFAHSSTETATTLLYQVTAMLNVYGDRVDNLEYKKASQRLAYHLLFLAYRFGKKRDDGAIVLEGTFTQQDIAASINMARESVSREMDKFQKKGCVGTKNRQIVIKDAKALSENLSENFSLGVWGLD